MWEPLELGEQEKQLLLEILVQQQQLMAKLNIQASAIKLTTQELVNGPSSSPRFDQSGEQAEGTAEVRTPHTVMHAGQPKPGHILRASGDAITSPAVTVDINQHPPPPVSPAEVTTNKMAVHEMFHYIDQSADLLDQTINTHSSGLTSAPKLQQLMDTIFHGLSGMCHSDDVMVGVTLYDQHPQQALHRSGEHLSTDIIKQSRYVLPIHPKTQPHSVLPKINQNVHIGSSTNMPNRRDPQSTGFAGRSEDTRRRALKISSTGGEDLRQIITSLLGNRLDKFDRNVRTDVSSSRKGQLWPWDPGPSRVSPSIVRRVAAATKSSGSISTGGPVQHNSSSQHKHNLAHLWFLLPAR